MEILNDPQDLEFGSIELGDTFRSNDRVHIKTMCRRGKMEAVILSGPDTGHTISFDEYDSITPLEYNLTREEA